jgi:hypothetical protein
MDVVRDVPSRWAASRLRPLGEFGRGVLPSMNTDGVPGKKAIPAPARVPVLMSPGHFMPFRASSRVYLVESVGASLTSSVEKITSKTAKISIDTTSNWKTNIGRLGCEHEETVVAYRSLCIGTVPLRAGLS